MKKMIYILAALAVLQTVLIVTNWTGNSGLQSHSPGGRLLSFEKKAVDMLLITDGEEEVRLTRKENKWLLKDGFPADGHKVDALLEKLTGLQYGLPVADSSQALGRFKVAEDSFERHLQLQNGGKLLSELYLGTGAGARQSHVRNGEQKKVYSVAFGSYDLPVTPDSWQDKELLQFKKGSVTAMEIGEVKLRCEAEESKEDICKIWQGEALPPGRTINQKAVYEGVAKLAALRFSQVLGRAEQPEYNLSQSTLTLKLFFADGDRTYSFGKIKDSEEISLKVSDRDEYFKLASHLAKPILEQFEKVTLPDSTSESPAGESMEAEK